MELESSGHSIRSAALRAADQAQIVIVYLAATLNKLHGSFLPALDSLPLLRGLATGAVCCELFLAVGLVVPRRRRLAVWTGVALHGAIWLLMGVLSFGLLMTASY